MILDTFKVIFEKKNIVEKKCPVKSGHNIIFLTLSIYFLLKKKKEKTLLKMKNDLRIDGNSTGITVTGNKLKYFVNIFHLLSLNESGLIIEIKSITFLKSTLHFFPDCFTCLFTLLL